MTTWWCSSTHLTASWNPATNLLETRAFSASLARATASSTAGSSSGLSSQTKIGIGVGVAAGVGVVLLAGVAFLLWRRRQKTKERLPEGDSQLQAPYSVSAYYEPRPPSKQHAWNSDSSFDYYHTNRGIAELRGSAAVPRPTCEWKAAIKNIQERRSRFVMMYDIKFSASHDLQTIQLMTCQTS